MYLKPKAKGKNLKIWLVAILLTVVIIPAVRVMFVKFEGEAPVLEMNPLPEAVSTSFEVAGKIHDLSSGLRKIRVTLTRNGKETVLLEKSYDAPAWFKKGHTTAGDFSIPVSFAKNEFPDGKATLTVMVRDYSWRDWWNGNKTLVQHEFDVDTQTPRLTILSRQHNVSQGGSGLLVYRLSEPCVKSGVMVGDDFFPGHAGYFSDKQIYLAFFAVPIDHTADKGFFATAVDRAGNTAKSGFYHYLRKKAFRKDVLTLSDAFLSSSLMEFQEIPGVSDRPSPVEQFIFINSELRKKNNQTILANGQKTEARISWEGRFGRLPNSAPRASFADHREYVYDGAIVSRAIHMGVDLASTRNVEIPAANSGKVVFAEYVGIYGNLVCIDHGFGLMSIYAHLNQMTVKPGDRVAKNDVIGYSGVTGMAGGDHLHFGMFIDHVFVNPVEWWDESWIANNITDKLKSVTSSAN